LKTSRSTLTTTTLAVLISVLTITPAFAGGLNSATAAATSFKIWFYGFVGIVAVCYLLYKGVEAWTDRAHWSDFGIAIAKVAAVGGVVVIAPWAWNLFVG
jgi:hypothetical protein